MASFEPTALNNLQSPSLNGMLFTSKPNPSLARSSIFRDVKGSVFMASKKKIEAVIPHDVVVEILATLPVKSLLRFRCVCKTWNQLILDPNFIVKHRNLRINEGSVMFNHHQNRLSWLSSSFEDDTEKIVSVVSSTSTPIDYEPPEYGYHHRFCATPHTVIASCNGLLCICEDGVRFTLWNPATRESKRLLNLFVSPLLPVELELIDEYWFGFGFDLETKDYKVLKFDAVKCDASPDEPGNMNLDAVYYQIELYSLNQDSWKVIQPFEDHHKYKLHHLTYNDNEGICYWLGVRYDMMGKCIVSFDMTSESFQKILLPECLIRLGSVNWWLCFLSCKGLGIVNGCLALVIGNNRFVVPTEYEIWILGKDGENASWLKHASCGTLPNNRCLGLWNNDALCLEDDDGQLFMYSLIDQHLKKVKGIIEDDHRQLQFLSYYECLVPIYGIKYNDEGDFIREDK